ncbi:MAG: MAPEG family protein [Caulobacteraceae bacterium]|nr:MAPEG family protein [Caulobacteraceae bacterium]
MHNLVALITLAALLFFFWTCLQVGKARGTFNVPAPATTGHPEFERYFRVQNNTLEGLILFLPSLWLFALAIDQLQASLLGDKVAAVLGLIWIIGRVIYMRSYVKDPASRSLGFGVQMLASMILLVGALIAVVVSLLKTGL